jgi:hypothetical protein
MVEDTRTTCNTTMPQFSIPALIEDKQLFYGHPTPLMAEETHIHMQFVTVDQLFILLSHHLWLWDSDNRPAVQHVHTLSLALKRSASDTVS